MEAITWEHGFAILAHGISLAAVFYVIVRYG